MLLTVAYDGTAFSGWAPQPNARTVAGDVLAAIRTMDPDVVEIRGASRTDAGVHARGQRAAFTTTREIPSRGWVLGVQSALPDDVAIRRASVVDAAFVPRFRSTGKRYVYSLLLDPLRDPLVERWSLRVERPIERARLRDEALAALGTHDFAAFRGSSDERTDTVRTIRALDVRDDPADARLVRLVVEGDGFLYNMVRILVGTLVDVALGRLAPGAIERALASHDRRDLGRTAPAHGLCLDEVFLDDAGRDAWP